MIIIKNKLWQEKSPIGVQTNFGSSLSYGLLGAWMFNETCGLTVNNLPGFNMPGTLTHAGGGSGVPTWAVGPTNQFGPTGSALSFNAADLQYVQIGTNSNLFITNQMSIASLFSMLTLPSSGNTYSIAGRGSSNTGSSNENYFFSLFNNSGTQQLQFGTYAVPFVDVVWNNNYVAGGWYHAVGTFNGNTLLLYSDGAQVGSTSYSGSLTSTTGNFTIGAINFASGAQRFFNGLISYVMVWNRALTPTEVQTLYNNPLSIMVPKRNFDVLQTTTTRKELAILGAG